HARSATSDSERGRLDDSQRADELRVLRRGEERDDAAVGMAEDMRSRLEVPLEPDRLVLEVDPLDGWPRRESTAGRHGELATPGERLLGAEGHLRIDDGTVHEQKARPSLHAGFGCHKVPPRERSDTAILASDAGD